MTTPSPQFKHLFTPLKIGAFTVKNRIVSTGHLSNFAVQGLPSERHFNYWVNKARGGVGLIVTEDQAVHPSGGSEPFVIQAYRDECVEPFQRITSAVHEHGAKMVAQLFHPASNWFPTREEGLPLWSAGPVSANFNVESTHEIDREEIQEVIDSYRLWRGPNEGGRAGRRRADGRARLPDGAVPLAADEPAQRRVRRLGREPDAVREGADGGGAAGGGT